MMKIKIEYILLALVIIGLSAYLYYRKTDRTLYELPQIAQVAQKDITKVEIDTASAPIVLNKKDDLWYISPQDYLADSKKVRDMLRIIADLTVTALVSESKDYIRYDLNDEKQITVKAWEGDKLIRDFNVGKAAASFRHTFVKLSDDERVFHARDNFRIKFEQTIGDLWDKKVFAVNIPDILQIKLATAEEALTFTREKKNEAPGNADSSDGAQTQAPLEKISWKTTAGEPARDNDLIKLLTSLSNLNCENYIDHKKKEAFSDPVYTIELAGAENLQLSIFAKLTEDAKEQPATSSQSDYPFFLSDFQVNNITKSPSQYLEKPVEKKNEASDSGEAPEKK